MVFRAEQTVTVPSTDLISWIFDEVSYDQDKIVGTQTFRNPGTKDTQRRSSQG